jgi:DNA-binding NarL/FixJ family response regulator
MTLRVVVADDQALVRVGFCGIIAATPGFTVVGEAGNGAEAVEAARRTSPDVILMDVRMPVMDGIEATRRITASSDVRALILTTFDLDEYVFAALRAGASGFLLKDTLPADLLTAIRVVAAGEALLAPSVTRRLIGEFTRTQPSAGPGSGGEPGSADPRDAARVSGTGSSCDRLQRVLTERELEVLKMVARGLSNAEIAEELTISPATAKTHVAHLLTKLDSRDRIQLVIIAYQSGLVAVLARGQSSTGRTIPKPLPATPSRPVNTTWMPRSCCSYDLGLRHPCSMARYGRCQSGRARSVREVAPVVLEDEADRGEHGEQRPDQEEPPSDREAERGRGRGEAQEQRPPAVRAEEPDLAGALLDLGAVVVLRAPGQAAPGEQHVEAGEHGEKDGERERYGAGRFLRGVPVHDVGTAEEEPAAEEQPAFDLHISNLYSRALSMAGIVCSIPCDSRPHLMCG